MSESQPTHAITPAELLAKVQELRQGGYRLVQMGATRLAETVEVNYTFDRDLTFLNLRLTLPPEGVAIPSISGCYWCAFLYENELHDLFGLNFTGIVVDYKGKFYKTAVRHPFGAAPATRKGA